MLQRLEALLERVHHAREFADGFRMIRAGRRSRRAGFVRIDDALRHSPDERRPQAQLSEYGGLSHGQRVSEQGRWR